MTLKVTRITNGTKEKNTCLQSSFGFLFPRALVSLLVSYYWHFYFNSKLQFLKDFKINVGIQYLCVASIPLFKKRF